ncbi:MAG: ATP-dependent Clp protease adaptor ClpS [Verrucomicrobia bacterium]|nr:ATP-dependent Clp protease adaptor ClpS [Verrucomicrobiota bacterium]
MGGGIENSARDAHAVRVAATIELPSVSPGIIREEETESKENLDPGYLVICWNDPVNLMDFVTHAVQQVFAWKKEKAEFHMMQVHNQGKSVLTRETMERAEFYVHELQKYQLHATMEPGE